MRTSVLPVLLTFATLVGCSGGSSSITADPADGQASDGGDPPRTELDAGFDATVRPDATTTPDGAVDNRIDPIDIGRTWTYDVTILGTYPLCKAGSNTGRVLGQKVVGGKQAFQVQSFCPGFGTSSYAVDGDKVELYYGSAWILSLDSPVAEGHTWTDGLTMYVWEKVGSLTSPAGTYDDCWKARPKTGPSYTTFCRGIGPVRWHFVDASGNGYDATLTASTHLAP